MFNRSGRCTTTVHINDRGYTIMYRYPRYYTCIHAVLPPLHLLSDISHGSSSSDMEGECRDDTTASSNSDVARKMTNKMGKENADLPQPQKRHRFTKYSSWSSKNRPPFRSYHKPLQQPQNTCQSETQRPPSPTTPIPLATVAAQAPQPKCDQTDCWPRDSEVAYGITINNNTINGYYNDDGAQSKKPAVEEVVREEILPVEMVREEILPVEVVREEISAVVEHIVIEKQLLSMADARTAEEDSSPPLSIDTLVDCDNDNDDNESLTAFVDTTLTMELDKNQGKASTTPVSNISSVVSKRYNVDTVDKPSFKYEMKIKEIDNNIVTFSRSFLGTVLFVVLLRLLF
ncbi:uncharacterized protein LOC126844423 isoform X2 [Adelges cooleyi]|uniref:uncharacterized protein LOC126844423 isoform X2 n=1 Tax=Adelges cooleyi TaxID=133065 RepID=UPI0021805A0A|nr:uncharacterized protein LOC126844423 isoform X2 [Adelges cooleyi]